MLVNQYQKQWHHGYESSKFWQKDMLSCLEIHGLESLSTVSIKGKEFPKQTANLAIFYYRI